MSVPILASKLYIPRSDARIDRPHLFQKLNDGLNRKLMLVAAPAGSGKTSLVSTWIREIKSPVAWLSLDSVDSDPPRFASYLVAACQQIEPTTGQAVLDLLQSPQPPQFDVLITLLLDDFAKLPHEQFLLVLDDYHLIAELTIHEGMRLLLKHLPPQIHLVVITREDPPFPLPTLRVRQQMAELRAEDLRFTTSEATAFFKQTTKAANLSPQDIQTLARRTEGWIAGLQLAAISLQNSPAPSLFVEDFAGDDRYVVDYLLDEVLDKQPPQVLDFLHRTSILQRFTVSLCQALTDQPHAADILAYLEESNLFLIALDNRRKWYRYHHLFGELLSHRLEQAAPTQIPKLHRLASQWHQEHGFIEEAIHHALAGEDYEYGADLIEQVALQMGGQGRLSQLQRWIVSFPEAFLIERPYLTLTLALKSILDMQVEQAEQYVALAEPRVHTIAEDSVLKPEIMCQVALLRGYISRLRGDIHASMSYLQQAIHYLPEHQAVLHCSVYLNLGANYWILGRFTEAEALLKRAIALLHHPDAIYPALVAVGGLSNVYFQQGRFSQAVKLRHAIEQQLPVRRRSHLAITYVVVEQIALSYEKNDLTAAAESISQAIELGRKLDITINIGTVLLIRAWIKHVTGQSDEVEALLMQANSNRQPYAVEFDYYQVRLWLAMGNLEAASRWARAYEQERQEAAPWQALLDLTHAHVLFAENQLERAIDTLKQCERAAQSVEAVNWVVRSLALKAVCYQACDDEQALSSLQQAITLAAPEGYCRTFIDLGSPMQQLLQIVPASTYVTFLLRSFTPSPQENPITNLVEPLNDRELAILRLMAAGLSNREIAEELYLSINTIKWYSTHIYSKLGVSSRTKAVARAKENHSL